MNAGIASPPPTLAPPLILLCPNQTDLTVDFYLWKF